MSASAGQQKLSFGLIGTGAMGRVHAELLASRIPAARLVAVADVNRSSAEECAARAGVSSVYEDYRGLLGESAIDAVVIATPFDTHAEIIEHAAARGTHIFCEKPLDGDLEKISRALAAVAQAGVKLQVGFNRRFDADFRRVHDAVASGKIGSPHTLHIISRDPVLPPPAPAQDARALFLDSTIHDFDMARYLLGDEIASIYALVAPAAQAHAMANTALITLQFAGGAMGTIDNGRAVYGYDQRVEVFGSEGAARVENEQPHRLVLADREGVHASGPLTFFRERYGPSYLAELSAFVDCILQDTEPAVTGGDGRTAVELALTALRSLREGRPVAVSETGQG